MKSSTKCFIVTTLRSLKVTSTDHQKYVEIWKSNIKMFWNSQYNVTQELSTFQLAQSRRKTLNKLWKYCNMEGQLLQNKICITFLFNRKWGFCLGTVDGQKEYWKYNQWLVGGYRAQLTLLWQSQKLFRMLQEIVLLPWKVSKIQKISQYK